MPHLSLRRLILFCAVFCSAPAAATWSIVAVDPTTREVGLAAATCNPGVQFVAAVVPGAGVVAAQAETSFTGRERARAWIADGIPAREILQRLSDPELYSGWFNAKFPDLQYGVATLNDGPQAGHTGGDNLIPWSGGRSAITYSVQGNTLRGEGVVTAAASAFLQQETDVCRLALGERLLRALEAGRDAGGDKRCPESRPAISAILIVASESADPDRPEASTEFLRLITPREISLLRAAYHAVVPYEPGENAAEPVRQLRDSYEAAGGRRCLMETRRES